MRPMILSISILLLVASAFAFDIGQYLSANESNAQIDKEFFTINHTVYYIVNVSGTPTFLVKVEDLVTNQTEIQDVLQTYYLSKYAVNTSDTNALKSYFLAFNASRNDGSRFKGQEEAVCRKYLLLEFPPGCTDVATCNITMKKLCNAPYFQGATSCNNPEAYLPYLEDFSFSSNELTSLLADIFDKLDNINQDNGADYIAQIKKDVPLLKADATKLEKTPFRYPNVGETCPVPKTAADIGKTCYGVCPDIDLDQTSLSRAETLVNNLSAKMAPLAQFQSTADSIYNNTQTRLQENTASNLRSQYMAVYSPLKSQAGVIKAEANTALALVDNATMKAKVAQLTTMEELIEDAIEANRFSDLNSSFSDYKKAMESLNASIAPVSAVYDNVTASYRTATVYLFMAEAKALSPDDATKLNTIRQKKIVLDQQFKPGLTATQYEDLKSQYEALAAEEKAIVSGTSPVQALYMFTGMSNKLVDGMDSLIVQASPLTYVQRAQASSYMPLGLSATLFLSFSSVVLFLFLIYYAITPRPIGKLVLVVLAMFLVFVIGIVSLGIFFSIDKSLGRMDYSEFMDIVKYTKSAAIVVQMTGAEDAQTLASMRSCASSISDGLSAIKIQPYIYENGPSGCTMNGTAAPNCLDKIAQPLIMLNASAVSSSSYSGLFTNQASMSGDRAFFDTCPFAEALKIS